MSIHGSWTELVPHDPQNHADVYRRVFEAGSQRLFAGSSIRPLGAVGTADADDADATQDIRFGTILRREAQTRSGREERPAGVFDCRIVGHGVFHLGVVLADPEDWGNGLGMDAMTAMMRYMFHTERCRVFEMFAGVHNTNTVRILANGMVTPEAVWRDCIADGPVLRDLVVGSITATEFTAAGYTPTGIGPRSPAPTDDLWHSVSDEVLPGVGA